MTDDEMEAFKAAMQKFRRAADRYMQQNPSPLLTFAGPTPGIYALSLDVMYGPATCGSKICTRLDHRAEREWDEA